MILRWLEIFSNYDFKVVSRPDEQQGNADVLSRTDHYSSIKEEKVEDTPTMDDAAFVIATLELKPEATQRLFQKWSLR